MNALSIIPDQNEWTAIKEMGTSAYKSGLIPSTIKTPEAAAIIILKGRELGLPPMVSLAHIIVINGKPTCSAELMLAEIRSKVPGATINFIQQDNNGCVIEAKRKDADKLERFEFTIEDAKRANLLGKDVWKNYPSDMCFARAVSRMKRRLFTEVLMGLSHVPEELEDLKDVTPQSQPSGEKLEIKTVSTLKNHAPQTAEEAQNWKPSEGPTSEPQQNEQQDAEKPFDKVALAQEIAALAKKAGYNKESYVAKVKELTKKEFKNLTEAELVDVAVFFESEAHKKEGVQDV